MKKQAKREIRYIKHYGDVGAGQVVPFTPRNELVPVVLPANVNIDNEQIGAMTVRGPSLTDEGIFDGDELILNRRFTKRDITPDTVCIVFIAATGELVAKKVIFNHNMIILHSSGGGIKDKYYQADDIEIRAIVIGFQRMRDEFGRLKRKAGDEIPF